MQREGRAPKQTTDPDHEGGQLTPHQKLIAAIDALIDQRCTDPLAAIPVITTKEFLKLTAPPAPRLLAAGLRRGYPKTTAITLDPDPWGTY